MYSLETGSLPVSQHVHLEWTLLLVAPIRDINFDVELPRYSKKRKTMSLMDVGRNPSREGRSYRGTDDGSDRAESPNWAA